MAAAVRLLVVFGCVFGVLFAALAWWQLPPLYELTRHGVWVTATVERTEPQNHNAVYYWFVVDGTTYHGAGGSHPPNPAASRLHVGGPVQVMYSPHDPGNSTSGDPGPFGGAVFSIILGWSLATAIATALRLRAIGKARGWWGPQRQPGPPGVTGRSVRIRRD